MNPFTPQNGVVLPLDRAHVDTDAILPKQYLKAVDRSGFGANLFDDWRYLDPGEPFMDHSRRRPNPDCILNSPAYRGARILLARENFGCGSSREHAVWALVDFGIRVVIAPSFADIFYHNTCNNGLLALPLAPELVERLFAEVRAAPGARMTVDLAASTLTTPAGETVPFTIDPFCRHRLLDGLDQIALTLLHGDAIKRYEQGQRARAPWLFAPPACPR